MPFVVVDIGNTHLKLGLFSGAEVASATPLPEPAGTLSVTVDRLDEIADWLRPHSVADVAWYGGSVQRSYTTELVDWLHRGGRLPAGRSDKAGASAPAGCQAAPQIILLCAADLPLRVELPRPDMVGIDRLLAAVGVNALRQAGRA